MTSSALIWIAVIFVGVGVAFSGSDTLRAASLLAIPIAGVGLLVRQDPRPSAWWGTDRLGLTLAIVALVIGLCASRFALRQFEGEKRGGAILASSLAVVASLVATDLARNLAALAISWIVTSACTVALLKVASDHRKSSPARRTLLAFGVADGLMVAGVLVASSLHGGISLTAPLTDRASGLAAGVLLGAATVAACARAGLSLGRSWVTATISAPTSVSALLHAGVVNAGALLLLRVEGVTGTIWVFSATLAVVCITVLVALAPRIHARPDLKGQLAASTISQMAFMLLAVALGWPLLAITHLVGHGIYKAGRFMAAGGATEARARLRRRDPAGAQLFDRSRVAGCIGLLSVASAAGLAVGADGLAAMGVVGPAAAVVWWQRTKTPLRGPLLTWVLLAAGLAAYGSVIAGAQAVLGDALPPEIWRAPWWSLGAAVGFVAIVTGWRRRRSALAAARVEELGAASIDLITEVAA
jgi:NADH:ubiquinone oxidoreductase subunit 5 (subunit L)/multisubunit Na+/H+ antiporter MnhA subunit